MDIKQKIQKFINMSEKGTENEKNHSSVGYGLNIQKGSNTIIWISLTWSLEEYQQANAQLYRQGQKETVIIHHILAKGTVDELVYQKLQTKEFNQNQLLEALKLEHITNT